MAGVGDRLKQLRKDLGFPQRGMSIVMEVSLSTYQRYERGKTPIPLDRFFILVDKYEVNMNWVIAGKGDMYFNREKVIELLQLQRQAKSGDFDSNQYHDEFKLLSARIKELKSELERVDKDLQYVKGGKILP